MLLRQLSEGDLAAQDQLYGVVRDELRRVAGGLMRNQPANHTLQPTAVVHEAWIRLVGGADRTYENRKHFLGVASKAMRAVLVDHVRRKRSSKRGGDRLTHGLDEAVAALSSDGTDLLDLEEALEELERDDAELARLVELRFFGGLSQHDVATTLEISVSSVERMWRVARARLHRRLGSERGNPDGLE